MSSSVLHQYCIVQAGKTALTACLLSWKRDRQTPWSAGKISCPCDTYLPQQDCLSFHLCLHFAPLWQKLSNRSFTIDVPLVISSSHLCVLCSRRSVECGLPILQVYYSPWKRLLLQSQLEYCLVLGFPSREGCEKHLTSGRGNKVTLHRE